MLTMVYDNQNIQSWDIWVSGPMMESLTLTMKELLFLFEIRKHVTDCIKVLVTMNGRWKEDLRKPSRKDSGKVWENNKWDNCLYPFFPMIVEV